MSDLSDIIDEKKKRNILKIYGETQDLSGKFEDAVSKRVDASVKSRLEKLEDDVFRIKKKLGMI